MLSKGERTTELLQMYQDPWIHNTEREGLIDSISKSTTSLRLCKTRWSRAHLESRDVFLEYASIQVQEMVRDESLGRCEVTYVNIAKGETAKEDHRFKRGLFQ